MKIIATLNFKGGVGKTTVSWLLARYLCEMKRATVLVVDADPQMSLTTAVELLESGTWDVRFAEWYAAAKKRKTSLYEALREYAGSKSVPPIDASYVFLRRKDLQLLPSDDELYWWGLEAPPAEELRDFVPDFLRSLGQAVGVSPADYCIVDCPPAFNSLSFSVAYHADLILIPVNPDVFAQMGVSIMLNGLKKRLPKPPRFLVFMNRAKSRKNPKSGELELTKRSQKFLADISAVVMGIGSGMQVRVLHDVWIPDRAGIRDALAGPRLAPDLETHFAMLWDEAAKDMP